MALPARVSCTFPGLGTPLNNGSKPEVDAITQRLIPNFVGRNSGREIQTIVALKGMSI